MNNPSLTVVTISGDLSARMTARVDVKRNRVIVTSVRVTARNGNRSARVTEPRKRNLVKNGALRGNLTLRALIGSKTEKMLVRTLKMSAKMTARADVTRGREIAMIAKEIARSGGRSVRVTARTSVASTRRTERT